MEKTVFEFMKKKTEESTDKISILEKERLSISKEVNGNLLSETDRENKLKRLREIKAEIKAETKALNNL